MKGFSFILIASFMMITSSCSTNQSYEEIDFDENVKQIVFFSDDSNYSREAPYYDAIVELKQKFPKEFENMMVLTEDNASKYFNLFKVDQCPAILIFYQDEILVTINGEVTKEQIIQPLSNALSEDTNERISSNE
jgi:hypothetical protein